MEGENPTHFFALMDSMFHNKLRPCVLPFWCIFRSIFHQVRLRRSAALQTKNIYKKKYLHVSKNVTRLQNDKKQTQNLMDLLYLP